jgi:IS30 family transposase
MAKGYHHLTYEQRCQIYTLKAMGLSQAEIARQLSITRSTLSRELKRNTGKRGYRYQQAQQKARERRSQASTKPRRMTEEWVSQIEADLREEWSPVQIEGRLKQKGYSISHERIYQHVWFDKKQGGTLYTHLRHAGKKYNHRSSGKGGRGCIPHRIDIKDRPAVVDEKSRIGDWEGDLIIGAHHQGALLTYVDRKSKFTKIVKLPHKTAAAVLAGTRETLGPIAKFVHTITYDNGKEFAGHLDISKELQAQCFFATPYHSWERGLNEHTNGLIRQYFKKSSDFSTLTPEEIQRVEDKLNNRPRKVLQFKTPREVFMQEQQLIQCVALRS